MKLYERARQLRQTSNKSYMLWEASPNQWHDNCYVLDFEWRAGNSCGSIMTYFYTDGSGPNLAELVAELTDAQKTNWVGI